MKSGLVWRKRRGGEGDTYAWTHACDDGDAFAGHGAEMGSEGE